MMWYTVTKTNKIVPETTDVAVDNVFGAGTFDGMIESGDIVPCQNPSVIDILRQNGSISAATMRYREIHPGTDLKEARRMVDILKHDMTKFGGVG